MGQYCELFFLLREKINFSKKGGFSSDIGKNKDDLIYKLQFHTVKPDRVDDYIKLAEQHVKAVNNDENVPQG